MIARGFSLLEMLVVLAVAGGLVAMAMPSFQVMPLQERAGAALNQAIGAVSFARSAAVLHRTPVSLCPGVEDQCLGRDQWHRGALVFQDPNQNGIRDRGEPVLSALSGLREGDRLYWRSFRNRGYLRFLPAGYTHWQNGNFLYCPADRDPRLARMLIVNAQGRTRVARDADGDGVAEDARGRPIACP